MQWRPVTNDSDILRDGDMFRVWQSDDAWSNWARVGASIGMTLREFVQSHTPRLPWLSGIDPAAMVEVRRPVLEGGCVMVPEGSQWITDPTETIQPGDLYRVREDSHSDYCEWRPADHYAGTEVGYFAAWHSQDIQFCRPAKPAVEPTPGQPPAPTTDRGSKYYRTIRQSLPGDTHGLSLTVDVYDVCDAFGVTCPALQHAVKKLLCAGLRGAKSAEQDISEAANSCRRAIELLEFDL